MASPSEPTTMLPTEVAAAVREYITENFLYMRPDVVVAEQDSLMGRGIVDSMGVVELIAFLQERFSIAIEDEEITEANLGTLAAIARFVVAKGTSDRAA